MSDFQIRLMAVVMMVACIEFMACCYLYDQWDKQKKWADHWRTIAKEQTDKPGWVFVDKHKSLKGVCEMDLDDLVWCYETLYCTHGVDDENCRMNWETTNG